MRLCEALSLCRLRSFVFPVAFALGLAVDAGGAYAEVKVRFVHPERFSASAYPNGGGAFSPQNVMSELGRTLRRLGNQYLSPGETLTVDVLNIQLAGYNNWWSFPGNHVRVAGQAGPPPSIELRYVLKASGKAPVAAEETISNVDYLMNPAAPGSSDPLVYEKSLLEVWFRKRFAGRQGRSMIN